MEGTHEEIIDRGFGCWLFGECVCSSGCDKRILCRSDASTKKCTIVDKKPTSTTTTIVDNGTFKTRTEAETGMKTIKVCTEN